MSDLTKVVTELDSVKGGLHGKLIVGFVKADKKASAALQGWCDAVKADGVVKAEHLPANWSIAHPVCLFFLARFAEASSARLGKILSSTKEERKDWPERAKKEYQNVMRTEMGRYGRMRRAYLACLSGVVNTSEPRQQGNSTRYSVDERTIVNLVAIQAKYCPDEPTEHDVQCARFWTKTIDTFLAEHGTDAMTAAHKKALAKTLTASVSIKRKQAK
jgi:hypothetical protein